jgi:phosphate transport system substrate-binding protein
MKIRAASLAIILTTVLAVPPAYSSDPLTGPPFSDPAEVLTMPPEWQDKPLEYEEWAEGADIAVTLEQDVYRMLLPLIEQFEQETGIRVAVKEGTCGISAGMLSRKVIDIGGFCCPPPREDRLPGLEFHTLGIVAKAFLVHPENPVDELSGKELREIFRGKIHRWSEIAAPDGRPGPPLSIKPVGRFHCPLRPGHWRLLLDNEDLFSPNLYEVGSMPDMIAGVAANKGAIGWETLGTVEHYWDMGRVKPLRIDGYSPGDTEAMAAGNYPFYRTYNLTTWTGEGLENPDAEALVDYLINAAEGIDPAGSGLATASKLREHGWKFKGSELVGEPDPR